MTKYKLKFWFEHGGICLWSANEIAREKYGYAIETDSLPISLSLIQKLNALEDEYHTYLDWDCPINPSLWTQEHKEDFILRATKVYHQLCQELGEEYTIINEINSCV